LRERAERLSRPELSSWPCPKPASPSWAGFRLVTVEGRNGPPPSLPLPCPSLFLRSLASSTPVEDTSLKLPVRISFFFPPPKPELKKKEKNTRGRELDPWSLGGTTLGPPSCLIVSNCFYALRVRRGPVGPGTAVAENLRWLQNRRHLRESFEYHISLPDPTQARERPARRAGWRDAWIVFSNFYSSGTRRQEGI